MISGATLLKPASKRRQWIRLAIFVLLSLPLCAPVNAQDSKKVRMAYSAFSISFLNIFVVQETRPRGRVDSNGRSVAGGGARGGRDRLSHGVYDWHCRHGTRRAAEGHHDFAA